MEEPTSCKCYYAKGFKFKSQSHISLATFPNLDTSLEVLKYTLICLSGRLDVEMHSIEFLFWMHNIWARWWEWDSKGLGYIYKWQRCDNETPKWKWFGKMIGLYFCGSPRYGSFWIIVFKTPKTKVDNIQTMNLPIEEIAKQFGVGFKA